MLINFLIIQVAPGGPVEQIIAELTGQGAAITERVARGGGGEIAGGAGRGGGAEAAATAAPRVSIPSSSPRSKSSSDSTSRCTSASS